MDLALGGMVSGKIPRPLMPRVIAALAECTDIELEGERGDGRRGRVPASACGSRTAPRAFGSRRCRIPDIREVFENGALLHGQGAARGGRARFEPARHRGAAQGARVRVRRRSRTWSAASCRRSGSAAGHRMSKLLPNASPMQPRLLLKTDFDGDALNVLPLIVYGDPPCARVDAGKLHYLGGPLPLRNEAKGAAATQELELRLGLRIGPQRALLRAASRPSRGASCARCRRELRRRRARRPASWRRRSSPSCASPGGASSSSFRSRDGGDVRRRQRRSGAARLPRGRVAGAAGRGRLGRAAGRLPGALPATWSRTWSRPRASAASCRRRRCPISRGCARRSTTRRRPSSRGCARWSTTSTGSRSASCPPT